MILLIDQQGLLSGSPCSCTRCDYETNINTYQLYNDSRIGLPGVAGSSIGHAQ